MMEMETSEESSDSNLKGLEQLIEAVLTVDSDKNSIQSDNSSSETIIIRGKKLTKSQIDAFKYLKEKKIEEFFRFLIGHILANVPEDPISFLIDLLRECEKFRNEDSDPPLLFGPEHQEIIYRAMDPMNEGKITYEQYCNGMKTMGVTNFPKPEMDSDGMIDRLVFLTDADRLLTKNLADMIDFSVDVEDEEEIILPLFNPDSVSSEFRLFSRDNSLLINEKFGTNKKNRIGKEFFNETYKENLSSIDIQ